MNSHTIGGDGVPLAVSSPLSIQVKLLDGELRKVREELAALWSDVERAHGRLDEVGIARVGEDGNVLSLLSRIVLLRTAEQDKVTKVAREMIAAQPFAPNDEMLPATERVRPVRWGLMIAFAGCWIAFVGLVVLVSRCAR